VPNEAHDSFAFVAIEIAVSSPKIICIGGTWLQQPC
jgi:hypothetical protein